MQNKESLLIDISPFYYFCHFFFSFLGCLFGLAFSSSVVLISGAGFSLNVFLFSNSVYDFTSPVVQTRIFCKKFGTSTVDTVAETDEEKFCLMAFHVCRESGDREMPSETPTKESMSWKIRLIFLVREHRAHYFN